MAKKKKHQGASSGRGTSATATGRVGRGGVGTGSREAAPGPVPVRPAPATPGGPNRLVRKEEARRQREAIRRKMVRRRFLKFGTAILAVLVAAAAVIVFIVTRPNPAEAAKCGPVTTIRGYGKGEDRTHIGPGSKVPTSPPLSTYASIPPTSGPHNPTPLDAGVYTSPPDVYRAIHSLEHASAIIWYNPADASSSALAKIESFYRNAPNNDHVIVAPYSYPSQGDAGKFPAGKAMVLVAWHHMQECGNLNLAAVQAFVHGYRYDSNRPADYKGDAPEKGVPI